MADRSCPVHPGETEFYAYPQYPNRAPRCKSCVREGRKKSSLKADGVKVPPREVLPKPSEKSRKAPDRWHWSWGPPPGGWRGPPSKSPDAWGPYRGSTDDELRYRKSRRGMPGYILGYAWMSPDEWERAKKYLADRPETPLRKHGLP